MLLTAVDEMLLTIGQPCREFTRLAAIGLALQNTWGGQLS